MFEQDSIDIFGSLYFSITVLFLCFKILELIKLFGGGDSTIHILSSGTL